MRLDLKGLREMLDLKDLLVTRVLKGLRVMLDLKDLLVTRVLKGLKER